MTGATSVVPMRSQRRDTNDGRRCLDWERAFGVLELSLGDEIDLTLASKQGDFYFTLIMTFPFARPFST